MTFPFFLAFEDECFGLWGGDEGVATGDEGWAGYLAGVVAVPEVALDRDPTIFDGDDRCDLGRGDLDPFGSISREVEFDRSFDGLEA